MNLNTSKYQKFLTSMAFGIGQKVRIWKIALPIIEKIAQRVLIKQVSSAGNDSKQEYKDRFFMKFNVLRAALKAYDKGAPAVRKCIQDLFIRQFLGPGIQQTKDRFRLKYGINPPGFMTISPEGCCNLKCHNCYAASIQGNLPRLSKDAFSRILDEKYNVWGSWFNVISGGEPFIWRDGDTDLIDMAMQYQEQYFMVYTNGTLIDKQRAKRMAEAGNISPALSVEGFEKETDQRRGKGTYKLILQAFENLREAGVPFGISVTATDKNAEILLKDDLIDFYFDKQGAIYQWVFQYMPIGRGADTRNQISPEIRKKIWFKEHEWVCKRRLLIADFWNGGTFVSGCIAGGRQDGYLYVDWTGNVYPCVFVPYWKDNVHDLYSKGKTLTDALFSDLFQGWRDWQHSYSLNVPLERRGNLIRPCLMRDHHDCARDVLLTTGAKPGNSSAEICLSDKSYKDALKEYDKELAVQLDPIWNNNYKSQ
jgi:MoaA/NifB/PqqE/SkfB family radical SAM enzyme